MAPAPTPPTAAPSTPAAQGGGGLKSHLPLIAVAAVAAAVIFYLYRELQKAKRALVESATEDCRAALVADSAEPQPKRVRFESHEVTAAPAKGATKAAGSQGGQIVKPGGAAAPAQVHDLPAAAAATGGKGAKGALDSAQ